MTAAAHRRRGLLQRPFLLFGLLLLLPALGFGLLGWTSVLRERSLAGREAAAEAGDIAERRMETLAGDLWEIEAREADRPYYHFQRLYAPEETTFQQLDFQPSPLLKGAEDPRLLGWFQWELSGKGAPEHPATFGPEADSLAAGLLDADGGPSYADVLRARLEEASAGADHLLARRVEHPLRVVQANEERGQLYEELQIAQQRPSQRMPEPAAGTNVNPDMNTPYLKSFLARVGDEPVPVRYGSYHYLARAPRGNGIPLVAWRLVWIPATHAERREVTRDRWLLQGYALDPGRSLPRRWEHVGAVRLCRVDLADPAALADASGTVSSLADFLDIERVGEPPGRSVDPRSTLALVALPDQDAIEAAYADAKARYLWLLAGVVVVVVVGFVVLTGGLRREIALARRKEDFLAAVTHELKTPLTGIRMYADMLKEGWVADAESAARYATRIGEESDRLGRLVDQVLDFAAWERGVAKANRQPGDLAAAVGETVALVASRAEQAGVDLAFEAGDDVPPVRFDARIVRPLVLNLLDNAIKYSEHADEKVVRVRVARDGDRVLLEVADRGVGIDAKVRRRLFEPFQRAGDEMTRSAPGVGIGLALVKRYAAAHDAQVTLDSEVGRGTTVRVRFPV